MRNIYAILLLLIVLLAANLTSCSCLRKHSSQEIQTGENTPNLSPIYSDSLDVIFKETDKVRVYEVYNFIDSHDNNIRGDSLFNYKIKKNLGILKKKEFEILSFIITDPNLLNPNYAPVRQPFHPNIILEFTKGKHKGYMLLSFGSEEVGVADDKGNLKYYEMKNMRLLARWASLVFPQEDYYKKLINI